MLSFFSMARLRSGNVAVWHQRRATRHSPKISCRKRANKARCGVYRDQSQATSKCIGTGQLVKEIINPPIISNGSAVANFLNIDELNAPVHRWPSFCLHAAVMLLARLWLLSIAEVAKISSADLIYVSKETDSDGQETGRNQDLSIELPHLWRPLYLPKPTMANDIPILSWPSKRLRHQWSVNEVSALSKH